MADMQAGICPFLGLFLQQRGRVTGPIGTVMTAGGVAGMVMTAPAGAFIDHTTHKRWVVVITGICTVVASFLILLSQSGVVVTISQVATAIAGAAIGPAVTGMTLGIVRRKGLNAQNGRNQAFNHAGNMVGAGLSGWQGFWLVMLISFAALPVRGLIAGSVIEHWGVWPVQALDGVGAGLQSVAVPGLVACLLSGTGRVNVGQGAVMTVQGVGASLSLAIGGWLAQLLGYRLAFFILGGFALVSLALWIGFAGTLRPACAGTGDKRRPATA